VSERSLADILLGRLARLHARRVLARFLRDVERATQVQQRVLFEKLRRNAGSAYGRDHGFASIRTYDDFARQVPVSSYEDLSPYVRRVMAGETNAMFGRNQRVLMFAMSSGTTDEPKYVPVTPHFLAEYRRGWNAYGVKAISDHPATFLRPILQVSSPMDEQHAPSGVPCGAITGLMAATQKRIVRRYYVTPPCTAYIADADSRYYTIMRLAMAGDVAFMITANPATQLKLARTADANAEPLIRDIHEGTLTSRFDVPRAVRDALAPRLASAPARARALARIADSTGRLLPRDVWNLGFLANWMGGTMGLYLQDFPEYFGDVPVRDIGLLASEARMSVPIEDGTPAGVLDVTSNFFEFIPAADHESPDPPVLRAHEVEPGREYFILLTTSAGFYRYDIGDQVRVTGFQGQAPVIEFLHRGSSVSSLTGEKLTEQQAVRAVEQACGQLGLPIRTFVLAPQWAGTPFYRLHLEGGPAIAGHPLQALAREVDAQLRAANIEYACKQDSGRLGPLELNPLPERFFAEHEAGELTRRGGRQEQHKHRYLLPMPGLDAEFPIAAPQPGPEALF